MISLLSGGNRKGMKGKMTQKTFWSLPPAAGMNLYLDSKLKPTINFQPHPQWLPIASGGTSRYTWLTHVKAESP